MNKRLSILVLLITFLCTCKKNDTPEDRQKKSSEVKTLSIQSPDPTKLILRGNIKIGDYTITEYGFIYGNTPDLNKKNGKVVSLGSNFEGGDFSKEIANLDISTGGKQIIYARAYFIDETTTSYGNELSSERPVFEIPVLSPLYGKTGDEITIKGEFFSPDKSDIVVTFSDIEALVMSVSDKEIVVTVPKGIPEIHSQRIKVNVINRGVNIEMTKNFEILAHVLDFSPKEGAIGSLISFEGDNLQVGRTAPIEVPIYFENVQAEYRFLDNFHVLVPMDIPETAPVYVAIKGIKTKLPGEFKLLKPVITDITPKSAIPGSTYKIIGQNLPVVSPIQPQPIGVLSNKSFEIYNSPYEWTFKTPLDIEPGDYFLTLKAGPFTVNSAQKITILPHRISSMQPKSGYFFTSVIIKGSFKERTNYDVYLNGRSIREAYCYSEGEVVIDIPADTEEGEVDISIQMGANKVSAGKFNLIYPKIASISPVAAKAGVKIILEAVGPSFELTATKPDVYLGDLKVSSNLVSKDFNQISIIIPADAKPGKQKIRLVYGDFDIISSEFFEVLH